MADDLVINLPPGNRKVGDPAPASDHNSLVSAVRAVADYVSDLAESQPGVDGLPAGGDVGQVLTRTGPGEAGWTDKFAGGGGGPAPTWGTLAEKPAYIAAGDTQAQARQAIGAGTSNLTLGEASSTAKRGNWEPTVGQIDATGTPSSSTFLRGDGAWATPPTGGGGGGVTSHGDLTGLDGDDHPQYLNQTRGDARYYGRTAVDTALEGKVDALNGVTGLWKGTQAQYDLLTPDEGTVYVIVAGGA